MSLSKAINFPEYWLKPRKWWLCPDMTEKLLTGMLETNSHISDEQPKSYCLSAMVKAELTPIMVSPEPKFVKTIILDRKMGNACHLL